MDDDLGLVAIDVADLQEDRRWLGPTIMVNPSPRFQTRTGLR
jgi:hypothetical protein